MCKASLLEVEVSMFSASGRNYSGEAPEAVDGLRYRFSEAGDSPHFVPSSQIAYILAGLTAGGGITGYVRAGSVPSLVAGCSVGALYALGGYRMQNRQTYGVELALLASVVLAGSSIPRALKSRKPLPTGLSVLALLGLYNFVKQEVDLAFPSNIDVLRVNSSLLQVKACSVMAIDKEAMSLSRVGQPKSVSANGAD
nr:tmem14 protein like [Quercus suber]